jgi:hypothetical protein
MLSSRTIVEIDGLEVADVACRHPVGPGREVEHSHAHAIVFVRRGCFVRSADGAGSLLDPTAAYCISPGQELRYDHPHDGGDDCTALFMAPELVASLWGGELRLPEGVLRIAPEVDLEHRPWRGRS